jgi:hypothetical protein
MAEELISDRGWARLRGGHKVLDDAVDVVRR